MVETTGRTRDEALAKALKRLGIRESDAEVTLLAQKRARFFGLFGGPLVKLRVARRGEGPGAGAGQSADAERVREIVRGILDSMRITGEVRVENGDGQPRVVVVTEDADGLLIGRHGQTLAALQHVANRILTRGRDNRPIVPVDIGGYRGRQGEPDFESSRRRAPRSGSRRPPRRARAGSR